MDALTRLSKCLDILELEHTTNADFVSVNDGVYEVVVSEDPDRDGALAAGLYEGKFELFEDLEIEVNLNVADALYFILDRLSV